MKSRRGNEALKTHSRKNEYRHVILTWSAGVAYMNVLKAHKNTQTQHMRDKYNVAWLRYDKKYIFWILLLMLFWLCCCLNDSSGTPNSAKLSKSKLQFQANNHVHMSTTLIPFFASSHQLLLPTGALVLLSHHSNNAAGMEMTHIRILSNLSFDT